MTIPTATPIPVSVVPDKIYWIMDTIAAEHGFVIEQLTKESRRNNSAKQVRARRAIAKHLHGMGIPAARIGRYLQMHHTSILHLLAKGK